MTTSNQRKRKRALYQFDNEAISESVHIKRSYRNIGPFSGRMNKTYIVDGFSFPTGKKHRNGGNWGN